MARGGGTVSGGPPQMDFSNLQQALQFGLQMKEMKRQSMVDDFFDWVKFSEAKSGSFLDFMQGQKEPVLAGLKNLYGGGIKGQKLAQQAYDGLINGTWSPDELRRQFVTKVFDTQEIAARTEGSSSGASPQAPGAPVNTVSTTEQTKPDGTKTVTEERTVQVPGPVEVAPSSQTPGGPPVEGGQKPYMSGEAGSRTVYGTPQANPQYDQKSAQELLTGKHSPLAKYGTGAATGTQGLPRDKLEEKARFALAGGFSGGKVYRGGTAVEDYMAENVYPQFNVKDRIQWDQKLKAPGTDPAERKAMLKYTPSFILEEIKLNNRVVDKAFEEAVSRGQAAQSSQIQVSAEAQAQGEAPVPAARPQGEYREYEPTTTPQQISVTRRVPVPASEQQGAPGVQGAPQRVREAAQYPRGGKAGFLESLGVAGSQATTTNDILAGLGLEDSPRGKKAAEITAKAATGQKVSTTEGKIASGEAGKAMWYAVRNGDDPRIQKLVNMANLFQEMSGEEQAKDNPLMVDMFYQANKLEDRRITVAEQQAELAFLEAQASGLLDPERVLQMQELARAELGVRMYEASVREKVAMMEMTRLKLAGDIKAQPPEVQDMYKLWSDERKFFNGLYSDLVQKHGVKKAIQEFEKLVGPDSKDAELRRRYETMNANEVQLHSLVFGATGVAPTDEETGSLSDAFLAGKGYQVSP